MKNLPVELLELAISSLQSPGGSSPCFETSSPILHDAGVERIESGFSNSEIWKLSLPSGDFAIRSWPNSHESSLKVAFWIAVNVVSPSNPYFPTIYPWRINIGQTISNNALLLNEGDQLWTLAEWVDGHGIEVKDVNTELVVRLASHLGALHRDTLRTPLEVRRMQAPGFLERQQALAALDPRKVEAHLRSIASKNVAIADSTRHVLCDLLEHVDQHRRWLSFMTAMDLSCHWIVRDLWHENILVTNQGNISSIVDLGAARLDWPGFDFARLIGSLIGLVRAAPLTTEQTPQVDPAEDLWKLAYIAYCNTHPDHSIDSLEECVRLDKLSSGLSIVQWLRWIADRTIDIDSDSNRQRVIKRLAQLCAQYYSSP